MFSSACSDSTCAGHHLLCSLMTTTLAKSRSQTEWAHPHPPPENRPPLHLSTNAPMWTLWRWGFWSDLRQTTEEAGTPRLRPPRQHAMMGYRSWGFSLFFYLCFIYVVIDDDEDDNWWRYGGPFWFDVTWQGHRPRSLTIKIIPVLTRLGNCGTCNVGQVIRATLSKTHPWSGWSSAVWF